DLFRRYRVAIIASVILLGVATSLFGSAKKNASYTGVVIRCFAFIRGDVVFPMPTVGPLQTVRNLGGIAQSSILSKGAWRGLRQRQHWWAAVAVYRAEVCDRFGLSAVAVLVMQYRVR